MTSSNTNLDLKIVIAIEKSSIDNPMNSITINQFINNLKLLIQEVIKQHTPIKVTDQNGEDFVVISAEDWEQQQETLFILQNDNLMKQISQSIATHHQNQGYLPNQEELNEILSL